MDLIVDAAAFPYDAVREAAVRRALRETGAARYTLTPINVDVFWTVVALYGQPVQVLTTPDRADQWTLLTDPTADAYRWCLRRNGVPADKVSMVAKKSGVQINRSKWSGEINDAIADMVSLTHARELMAQPVEWVEVERAEAVRGDYQLLTDLDDGHEWGRRLFDRDFWVALDFETEGDYPNGLTVVGFSFSWEPGRAYYVPLAGQSWEVYSVLLRAITDGPWVAHNAQYELTCLRTLGITPQAQPDDTMVLAWERGEPELGLKVLALKHLGVRMTTFQEVSKGRRFSEVPLPEAAQYACADADNTLRLYELFTYDAPHQINLNLYRDIDRPLIPILADMTWNGVAVDREWVERWRWQLASHLNRLEKEIEQESGRVINLSSPQQVSDLLFNHLGLEPQSFTAKDGVYSTDDDDLRQIKDKHPVVPLLLEYRKEEKNATTYAPGLLAPHLYGDGRVHFQFKGTGTETGRLASTGQEFHTPKLVRTPQGQNIPLVAKEAIVPDAGCVFIECDYSQIELRILAHMSQDPVFLRAFREGRNPHVETMEALFGTTDKHADDGRPYKLSKNINFGIPYGAGPDRLVGQALEGGVVLSTEDTKDQLAKHRAKYPVTWAYRERRIELIRGRGYAETLLGRRVSYPDLASPDPKLRGAAEREAFNCEIQGTNGDITKAAMVRWVADGWAARWPIRLQVHDSIVIQAPESEAQDALEWLVLVMRETAQQYLSIPVEVEGTVGRNWRECK